jgi:hypothetical protein
MALYSLISIVRLVRSRGQIFGAAITKLVRRLPVASLGFLVCVASNYKGRP